MSAVPVESSERPHVSVIVCAYNAEATLCDCLDSLSSQTADCFEVIVIDDGSTDGTARIALDTAAGFPRPLRCISTLHRGLAHARNEGLDASNSEYVAFVDADDIVAPEMIQLLLACARGEEADIVVCEMAYVDFLSGAVLHIAEGGDSSLFGSSVYDTPGLLESIGASACDKLWRRTLFASTGIRYPDGHIFEDLHTTYRLCAEARRISKVSAPLYRYRIDRPGSIMRTYDEQYIQLVTALQVTNDHFRDRGSFDAVRGDLLVLNFEHLVEGRLPDLLRHAPHRIRRAYLSAAFSHLDRYFPGWRRDARVPRRRTGAAKRFVMTHRLALELYCSIRALGSPRTA